MQGGDDPRHPQLVGGASFQGRVGTWRALQMPPSNDALVVVGRDLAGSLLCFCWCPSQDSLQTAGWAPSCAPLGDAWGACVLSRSLQSYSRGVAITGQGSLPSVSRSSEGLQQRGPSYWGTLSYQKSCCSKWCSARATRLGRRCPGPRTGQGQCPRPTAGPGLSPHCFSHFKNY